MIYSKKGCSTTETFTATISVTNSKVVDKNESNENAYHSTSTNIDILPQDTFSIEGNLNSSIDNDWFVINVPNIDDFNIIQIEVPSNVSLEIYKPLSGTTLQKFSQYSSNEYYIGVGTNYIRVFPEEGSLMNNSKLDYRLDFSVNNYNLSKVAFSYLSNGEEFKTQTYTIGGQRYAFLDSSVMEWTIYYLSKNGYLCTSVKDTAYIKMEDEAWDNPLVRYVSKEATSAGGITHVSVKIMPKRGQWTDLTLYYDYDVFLTLYSDLVGYQANRLPVFITSKIRS